MSFKADELHDGDGLSARTLNQFFSELERLGRISTAPPVTLGDDASGLRFGIDDPGRWWIKITSAGTGGAYAWTRVVGDPSSPGDWINSPGGETGTTSTDPAYESSSNTSVPLSPTPYVRAWRNRVSNVLFFSAGNC